MKNRFLFRQMFLLIILSGWGVLFLPFTLGFFLDSGLVGNLPDANNNSISFSVNYFEDAFYFINNFKLLYQFPYIGVLGIFMVLILPTFILLEFVFFYRYRYKTVLVLCVICIVSLLEFGYSHFEYLQYGFGILILQQLFLLLNLTLNKKLR